MIRAGGSPITPLVLLIGMPYSPWTERARWALDHHRLSFNFLAHEPVMGELSLRLRTRRLRGRVTVPVLQVGEDLVTDSVDIVRYADSHGYGAPLIPAELEREVLDHVAASERALDAARGIVLRATMASETALLANTPSFVPGPLRLPVARFGTGLFARKYGLSARRKEDDLETLTRELDALSTRIAAGDTLLGRFTLADIAVAGALQVLRPADNRHWRLTPAQRLVWQEPQLSERYATLLSWRDRLYDAHR